MSEREGAGAWHDLSGRSCRNPKGPHKPLLKTYGIAGFVREAQRLDSAVQRGWLVSFFVA